MDGSENSLTLIEQCLVRIANGDDSAQEELYQHAFSRLLAQCQRILRQELSVPNPMITENAVLAEASQRLRKAMESDKVSPTTAREFFGLAGRNIRWQVIDMLRKRSQQQGDTHVFEQLTGDGKELQPEETEKWELFWSAIDSLDDQQREVFDLIWVNGLSQYEAAEVMGKTRNQVDSIWRRIKIAISRACKDYGDVDF